MKAIDFTKPGGFPLTQDQLNYLQQAYTESIKALAAAGVNGTSPVIISGMVSTFISSMGFTDISPGWFFYNGELVRFVGGIVGPMMIGEALYVVISAASSPLTFNDGSTPNVILDKTAGVAVLSASTPVDATRFQFGSLLPFGKGFGILNREQTWHSLAVHTDPADGGVTGTIFYKKDFTANTLQIRGVLSANNAQNFAASPSSLFYLMNSLPSGYVPNYSVYFIAQYFVASSIQDDAGIAWIKQINCVVNPSAQILINWIKPASSVLGYGITFNYILPLD